MSDQRASYPDPTPSTDLARLAAMVRTASKELAGTAVIEETALLLAAEAEHFHPVRSEACIWRPWSNGFAVGFEVVNERSGVVRYLYLNPSPEGSDDPDGELATTFLYWGATGDPNEDRVLTYVDVQDKEEH